RQCRVARRQAAHRVARLGPGRSTLSRYTLLLVGPPLHSFACRVARTGQESWNGDEHMRNQLVTTRSIA
ncbi:hypothetical protein GW17_00050474, partial [Ensete ventricosum]